MPTLPLFDTPADPNAWHRVTAPGGYEVWHFDAADASGDVRVVVEFGEGQSFDSTYRRRYLRYRRNPTGHRPPVPSEYPFVNFALCERRRLLAKLVARHRPGALVASSDTPDLTIGPNSLARDPGGALRLHVEGVARPPVARWRMTWRGVSRRQHGPHVTADLTFRPLRHAPPDEPDLLAPHRRVVIHPSCAVEGIIRIVGDRSLKGQTREIAFTGRGAHDHRYGTAPLGTCNELGMAKYQAT
jgi:hypothetical protein